MVRRVGSLRGGEKVKKAEKVAAFALGAIGSFPFERLVSYGGRSNPTSNPTEIPASPSEKDQPSSPGSEQRVPVICAWCEKERRDRGLPPKILGYKRIEVPRGMIEPASHGICKECQEKHFPGVNTSPSPSQNPGSRPRYGPIGKPTPDQAVDWEEAQREAKEKYPIHAPQSLAEAERASVTPEELHLMVAHQMYLEKRERLLRRYIEEEEATPAGRREMERERRREERERVEENEEGSGSNPLHEGVLAGQQPLETAQKGAARIATERVETAGTQETIAWQRRQIAKEVYSLQRNLAAGGMIAGKPCDCLSGKHVLGLEALAEETMAMHQDPVYQEMLDWTKELDAKGTPEAIASGKYTEDYRRMAQEARAFRKRLLGTEAPGAMLTEQERGEILNRAKDIARDKADALVENQLEVESGSN